jgi:predicted CoA-binding protein
LGVGFDDGDGELKDLKKITKKIDLVILFEKINSSGRNTPSDLTKAEKEFYEQYKIYQKSVKENKLDNKEGVDANGNFIVVEGNEYYNAVFDFLV